MLRLFLSLCMFLGFTTSAAAGNIVFLKGDAFFSFLLSPDHFKQLEEKKSPVFYYSRLVNSASGCGHIGYRKIKLKNIPPEIRNNALLVGKYLRSNKITGKGWGWLFHPIVLIYNRDFPLNRLRIGLRYNERWKRRIRSYRKERIYSKRKPTLFPSLNQEENKVSKTVRPLRVAVYPRGTKQSRKTTGILEPLRLTKKSWALLFLQATNISLYGKRKEGMVLYRVTEQIEKFVLVKGVWKLRAKGSKSLK